MDDFDVADLLGCLGADLTDVSRMIGHLPAGLQSAAAQVEMASVTRANDPLSVAVHRLLGVVTREIFETLGR